MSVTLRINSVSGSNEITVEDGTTLDVALAEAGVPADSGLEAKVNGDPVEVPADVVVRNGDQVVATPRDVKLGL